VLQGADDSVFVADSQASHLQENLDSLTDLEQDLKELGDALAAFPFVVQLNKRDLPDTPTVEHLRRELNCNGAPLFEAVATQGVRVFDTLKAIINLVIAKVQMPA
jgi:mutual gliding-motility protein MglA